MANLAPDPCLKALFGNPAWKPALENFAGGNLVGNLGGLASKQRLATLFRKSCLGLGNLQLGTLLVGTLLVRTWLGNLALGTLLAHQLAWEACAGTLFWKPCFGTLSNLGTLFENLRRPFLGYAGSAMRPFYTMLEACKALCCL